MFSYCRRQKLIGKLLDLQAGCGGALGHDEEGQVKRDQRKRKRTAACSSLLDEHSQERLLREFTENELEILLRSVVTEGAFETTANGPSSCILARIFRSGSQHHPAVLTCRFFRWPDLDISDPNALHRLPFCNKKAIDVNLVCCNPFHWSRVFETMKESDSGNLKEYPRLPLSSHNDVHIGRSALHPNYLASDYSKEYSKSGLFKTNFITSDSSSASKPLDSSFCPEDVWCRMAYWEGSNRVGDMYLVTNDSVDVFTSSKLPKGSGFCLDKVSHEAIEYIGQGILVSREPTTKNVWVYNRTSRPIFIYSPTLDNLDPEGRHSETQSESSTSTRSTNSACASQQSPYKIPSGYSVRVFDYEKMRLIEDRIRRKYKDVVGPIDLYSVVISFAKGFGAGYTRQDVVSCPCWLHIYLKEPS